MILIDSHVLLWRTDDIEQRLSPADEALIDDPGTPVYVSIASLWELAIKAGKGKLKLPANFRDKIAEAGIEVLEISAEHALAVAALPALHGDPFDRMLVVQALARKLTLMTRDKKLADYGVRVHAV